MKKLLFCISALALYATNAQAQQNTSPNYCNAAAFYDTAGVGSTKLVNAPLIGGIYICGFTFGFFATTTISAQLTYSTAGVVNTNNTLGIPLVTGAAQVPITPNWRFTTATTYLVDHPNSYNGLFIPNGNQLNITTSVATGAVQAIVYYWTQNP